MTEKIELMTREEALRLVDAAFGTLRKARVSPSEQLRLGYVAGKLRDELASAIMAAVAAERERCRNSAVWAIHDTGLPPHPDNLNIRQILATAAAVAIRERTADG